MFLFLLFPDVSRADEIRIAVASNFLPTMKKLAAAYRQTGDHKLIISSGSSGKLYAQILNKAPFDLFFSADAERPRRLEKQGLTLPGSRKTYAIGQLALWCPTDLATESNEQCLGNPAYQRLAIANPRLAPYGKAAQQVLESYDLWSGLQHKRVRGDNIAQTFQFVQSGNAELGLVAYAQIVAAGLSEKPNIRLIPGTRHEPIDQQYVILTNNPANREFVRFLQSETAQTIILADGYLLPPPEHSLKENTQDAG